MTITRCSATCWLLLLLAGCCLLLTEYGVLLVLLVDLTREYSGVSGRPTSVILAKIRRPVFLRSTLACSGSSVYLRA
eukprot:COSAG01_NODE_5385_length_4293_cov_19.521221_8_plen_77_part_00